MATLVVTSKPRTGEETTLARYVAGVIPLIGEYGGVPAHRLQISEVIHGDSAVEFIFIADFPNTESIRSLFASEAYANLTDDRDKAFTAIDICIANDATTGNGSGART